MGAAEGGFVGLEVGGGEGREVGREGVGGLDDAAQGVVAHRLCAEGLAERLRLDAHPLGQAVLPDATLPQHGLDGRGLVHSDSSFLIM